MVMDSVTVAVDPGTGPRAAMIVGIACDGIGAPLLGPVREPGAEIGGQAPPEAREVPTPA
jgi:hypothetical protein